MYISERIPHVRRVVKKETFELLPKMQTERALGDHDMAAGYYCRENRSWRDGVPILTSTDLEIGTAIRSPFDIAFKSRFIIN